MAGDRRRLRGAEGRPLKGYAPLVVLVAAFVVMVAIVPSKVPADLASRQRPLAAFMTVENPVGSAVAASAGVEMEVRTDAAATVTRVAAPDLRRRVRVCMRRALRGG